MKLITKQIAKSLPALYATDGQPHDEKMAVVKFFMVDANMTWYIFEGEDVDGFGNYTFFAWAYINGESEFGYVTLSQLKSIRGKLGLPVERDTSFIPVSLTTIKAKHGQI